MTIIRRLALKISRMVVRNVTPRCKDWAEGLLQETSQIESDWAAFAWSLGSIRILIDRRKSSTEWLGNIPAAARHFLQDKRDTTAYWKFAAGWAFLYTLNFLEAKTPVTCFGCALVVFSSLSYAIHLLWERRRFDRILRSGSEYDAQFYRSELQRELTLWRQAFIKIGLDLFSTVGGILSQPGGPAMHPARTWCYCFFGLVIGPLLIVREYLKNQRRLDVLEHMLSYESH